MKLIKAYIRHRKIEEVYTGLKEAGFCSMTFVEGEGTGQYSDHEKKHVQPVIDLICENGRTGYRRDGMIIVSPVDEVFKVRTDETGILAI